MPFDAASVLNSASQASKLPPQAAAWADDTVATTSATAAKELKKGRKFIMSPPRKRFADEKVAWADEMSWPTAAKTRLLAPERRRERVAVADAQLIGGADAIGIGDVELRQIYLLRGLHIGAAGDSG